MSDTEAQAQSSEMAEKTSTTEATVSETTTAQDEPLTGSDEVIGQITDIDSYRRMVGSIQPTPTQTDGHASVGEEEADVPDQEAEEAATGTAENSENNQGDEGEGSEDNNGQAEAGQRKPPQYRWRPKSEVDALAMDIIKRSEKSGKEISLKDALAQAEAILKKDDSETGDEGVENDFPDTVTASETLLADLRAQRKQAFAKDLDFERAAELDEKIEALKDHIGSLKQAEILNRREQESRWNQTLEMSKAKAVELYPDVTDSESELVKKMVELDAILKETGNDLFYSPDKPLKLAQMAANELGIAPKKPGAQAKTRAAVNKLTTSSQPVKARPVQPASGAARTTQQNNQHGQFVVELDRVMDEESWRDALRKLKLAAS